MFFRPTQRPVGRSAPGRPETVERPLSQPIRKSGRRAAAAVEFAVVGLFFFPLLLGIFEIGRGFMVGHILAVASARGCRTGVVEGRSNVDVNATVNATLGEAGLTGAKTTVQVNNVTADASTANAGDEITVIVSIPVSSFTWVPGGRYLSGNLSAQYTPAARVTGADLLPDCFLHAQGTP